jgi:hypothetical protein
LRAVDRQKTLLVLDATAFVVGAASIGIGSYLVWHHDARVAVAPAVGVGNVGLVVRGTLR